MHISDVFPAQNINTFVQEHVVSDILGIITVAILINISRQGIRMFLKVILLDSLTLKTYILRQNTHRPSPLS